MTHIEITGRHIEVTDGVRAKIKDVFNKVHDRFSCINHNVTFSKTHDIFESHTEYKSEHYGTINASSSDSDFSHMINNLAEKTLKQLQKAKEK